MIAKARAVDPIDRLRGRRPPRRGPRDGRAGRRPGLQRHAPVGPRPPRPAAGPGRPGAAGRLARLPGARATSTSPATRSARELAAEAPYAEHTHGVAVPSSHDPAVYLEALAGTRLQRRRLGDDVPPRPDRPRPGLHLGLRHRRPADAAGAARRPAAGASRRSSSAACARRTPSATAASSCPSAGSSWSPDGVEPAR